MEDGTPTQSRGHENVDKGSAAGAHKRSISGGILGSLSFLRSSPKGSNASAPLRSSRSPEDDDEDYKHNRENEPRAEHADESSRRGSAMANALQQSQGSQGRKRKGSLRRLATGKMMGKMMRERRNSLLNQQLNQQRLSVKLPVTSADTMSLDSPDADDDLDDDEYRANEATPRRFSYERAALNSSSDSGWPPMGRRTASPDNGYSYDFSDSHDTQDRTTPRVSPASLLNPQGPYASTTDDDEALSFFRPTASSATSSSFNSAQLQSPLSMSVQRRRSNRSGQHSSLTIVHTPAEAALDDEWDYSETEWWGWVVLIATWIVFVVGMGSCLGVWSWAWDVGETPYAPPELEDDPTLPITGYYPALMVCTAVMAWVWVVVAWVGMKYFRHAKVVGEDG